MGVGGFHRAHLAVYVHELASRGSGWGIVGLGLLEGDAEMAAALGGQDCLYTLIEKGGGEPTAQVIGSITRFVHAPAGHDAAAAELIAAPGTAILSLTDHGVRLRRARRSAPPRAHDLRPHRGRARAPARARPPARSRS